MIRNSLLRASMLLLALLPALAVAQACGDNPGIPYTPLMTAARTNDVAAMRRILAKDANPNQQWHEKAAWNFHEGPPCRKSVLTIAVESGGRGKMTHAEGVRVLLDAGAKLDSTSHYYGPDAWLAAARVGDLAVLKLLWEHGDQDILRRSSSTVMPSIYQSMAVIPADAAEMALLDFLIDNTMYSPLDAGRMERMAANPAARPLVLHLVGRGVMPSPATVAVVAAGPDAELLATMLRKGVSVNGIVGENGTGGETVLMRVVSRDNDASGASVSALLDAGARVDLADINGMTALHYAVVGGNVCGLAGKPGCERRLAIVKLLLARGADPARLDYSHHKSALQLAGTLPEPNRAAFVAALQ